MKGDAEKSYITYMSIHIFIMCTCLCMDMCVYMHVYVLHIYELLCMCMFVCIYMCSVIACMCIPSEHMFKIQRII